MRHVANDPALKKYRRTLRKNQTDAEDRLWQQLRNRRLEGLKFFRQYSFGSYILDFYCPQCLLAIELDGSQHLAQQNYDDKRTGYLNQYGIEVMRFWDNDVLEDTDGVVEGIWQCLTRKKGMTKMVTPPDPLSTR